MNHLMLDLETLGTRLNAPIVSIGAVFFDITNATIGEHFYIVIDLNSSAQHGTIDADTVKWWMRQSDSARLVFNDTSAVSLVEALKQFSNFIVANSSYNSVKVWGNGINFDNMILREAYYQVGMSPPWRYVNDRDVRTIVDLAHDITGIDVKATLRSGVAHNALDDAIHQAKYVSKAFQLINLKM